MLFVFLKKSTLCRKPIFNLIYVNEENLFILLLIHRYSFVDIFFLSFVQLFISFGAIYFFTFSGSQIKTCSFTPLQSLLQLERFSKHCWLGVWDVSLISDKEASNNMIRSRCPNWMFHMKIHNFYIWKRSFQLKHFIVKIFVCVMCCCVYSNGFSIFSLLNAIAMVCMLPIWMYFYACASKQSLTIPFHSDFSWISMECICDIG